MASAKVTYTEVGVGTSEALMEFDRAIEFYRELLRDTKRYSHVAFSRVEEPQKEDDDRQE